MQKLIKIITKSDAEAPLELHILVRYAVTARSLNAAAAASIMASMSCLV